MSTWTTRSARPTTTRVTTIHSGIERNSPAAATIVVRCSHTAVRRRIPHATTAIRRETSARTLRAVAGAMQQHRHRTHRDEARIGRSHRIHTTMSGDSVAYFVPSGVSCRAWVREIPDSTKHPTTRGCQPATRSSSNLVNSSLVSSQSSNWITPISSKRWRSHGRCDRAGRASCSSARSWRTASAGTRRDRIA